MFGRLVDHAEANRAYPMRATFAAAVERKSVHHHTPAAYDQGDTSMCVAYSGVRLLRTDPVTKTNPVAVRRGLRFADFYAGAQARDGWALPHDGTTMRALMDWAREQGLVKSYHWGFSTDETLDTLQTVPVTIGISWVTGFDNPDAEGVVRYTGRIRGGHQVDLVAYDAKHSRSLLMNSWGKGWGLHGTCWVPDEELDKALGNLGDAVAVVV